MKKLVEGFAQDKAIFDAIETPVVEDTVEDFDADNQDSDEEVFQKFLEDQKLYSWSLGNLEKIIRIAGYDNFTDFFNDNEGAVEKIFEFFEEFTPRNPEWIDAFKSQIGSQD